MTKWTITSKAGVNMGIWEGETKVEALESMHREAGYELAIVQGERLIFRSADDEALCGNVGDWHFDELRYYAVRCRTNKWGDMGHLERILHETYEEAFEAKEQLVESIQEFGREEWRSEIIEDCDTEGEVQAAFDAFDEEVEKSIGIVEVDDEGYEI